MRTIIFQKQQELDCFNATGVDTFWNRKCTPVSEVCENFGYELSEEVNEKTDIPLCQNSTGHVHQLYEVTLQKTQEKFKYGTPYYVFDLIH